MKNLKVALVLLNDEDKIEVKEEIYTRWTPCCSKNTELFSISILDEISKVISEQLKINISCGVVREMLEKYYKVKNKTEVDHRIDKKNKTVHFFIKDSKKENKNVKKNKR
jgi:hypothetical protein